MRAALSILVPALALPLAAGDPSAPLTAAQRKEVASALAKALEAQYVFPDVAAKVSAFLSGKAASGGYEACGTAAAFASALTADLKAQGRDGHFRVRHDPSFAPPAGGGDLAPSPADLAEMRRVSARLAYGIAKVEHLPGNVGYLEVLGFGPTAFVGPAYSAAMQILSGTDALILDLRRNGGGDPESVAYLVSHFFPEGEARHLNSIYHRPGNRTRQYWTSAMAGPRYSRPVWVLTSAGTFSGGEECAYDLQTQKRATLVGETTGGGANPGHAVALGHGFNAFIPTGRAINPVTGTNWEHVGVKPDVAVPAAKALREAHLRILRDLLAAAGDREARRELEAALAQVEAAGTEGAR